MRVLLALALLMIAGADTAKTTSCEREAQKCQDRWTRASGAEADTAQRCSLAKEYRLCLGKVKDKKKCKLLEVPLSLHMEESLYCNMPVVNKRHTPCSAAQVKCLAEWSVRSAGLTRAVDRCGQARRWLECVQDTVTNFLCPDMGVHRGRLKMALMVNCVGVSKEECDLKQNSCRHYHHTQVPANSSSTEQCQAARDWRECLVNAIMSGTCQESVHFPRELDVREAKHCVDHTPRPSCQSQTNDCKNKWLRISQPSQPIKHRCKHAQRWVHCLERILQDGGCPGGYTVATEAQVEQVMSCHIIPEFDLDECKMEVARISVEFDVNRKYALDNERLCDLVQEAKAKIVQLVRKGMCPADQKEPVDVTYAEMDACKARYKLQCKKNLARCEDDVNKTTTGVYQPSVLCQAAIAWRSCITRQRSMYCKPTFPGRLDTMQTYCNVPPSTTTAPFQMCDQRVLACQDLYNSPQLASYDICARAKVWRQCLEGLREFCTVKFPYALNDIQANNGCVGK